MRRQRQSPPRPRAEPPTGQARRSTVTLTMREDVRVTGRPWIFVDVGGALRRADYIGPIGTATDALEFTYTVQAGDFDADGVALCASGRGCGSLRLNGGSIRELPMNWRQICASRRWRRSRGTRWMRRSHCPCSRRSARTRPGYRTTGR